MPEDLARFLLDPANCHPCRDIIQGKVTIPQGRGIYAWSFKQGLFSDKLEPELVFPVGEEGLGLCYLGISPDREESRGNLNRRLWKHLRRTARYSTLRLSLVDIPAVTDDLAIWSSFPIHEAHSPYGKR